MHSAWRSALLAIAIALLLAAITLFIIFRFIIPYAVDNDEFEPQFVIGNWDGQVAVFEGNASYPKQVFDVYVSTLPPQEKEKILAGIPVKDADQLSVLLEDYTS